MEQKKRFVQVGMGGRSDMYPEAIVDSYADSCELVGVCDSNQGRLRGAAKVLREKGVVVGEYIASDSTE